MLKFVFLTPKRHFLALTTSFDVLIVYVRAGVLTVDDWKNPQKKDSKHANIRGCIFRVYGETKPLDGSRPNFVWL